jgi:hypothetical protein
MMALGKRGLRIEIERKKRGRTIVCVKLLPLKSIQL